METNGYFILIYCTIIMFFAVELQGMQVTWKVINQRGFHWGVRKRLVSVPRLCIPNYLRGWKKVFVFRHLELPTLTSLSKNKCMMQHCQPPKNLKKLS